MRALAVVGDGDGLVTPCGGCRQKLREFAAAGELTIGAADDPHGVLPRARTWTVTVLAVDADLEVRVDGDPADTTSDGHRVSVTLADVPTGAPVRVSVETGVRPATQRPAETLFAILSAAQCGHEAKAAAWSTLESALPPAAKLAALHAQGLSHALIGALTEILVAR